MHNTSLSRDVPRGVIVRYIVISWLSMESDIHMLYHVEAWNYRTDEYISVNQKTVSFVETRLKEGFKTLINLKK